MPVFKTRPGVGKISNFGYDFDEVGGTEVDDADVAERLRKHFQFEEVVGKVSREAVLVSVEPEPEPENAFTHVVDDPPRVEVMTAPAPIKRKGRQPFPRDAEGNIIRPEKANG